MVKDGMDDGNRCLSEVSNQGYRAQEDNDLRREAQRRESSFVQQNQRRRHCCRSRCWVIVGSGSNSQRIIGLERHEERLHVIKLVIIKNQNQEDKESAKSGTSRRSMGDQRINFSMYQNNMK